MGADWKINILKSSEKLRTFVNYYKVSNYINIIEILHHYEYDVTNFAKYQLNLNQYKNVNKERNDLKILKFKSRFQVNNTFF